MISKKVFIAGSITVILCGVCGVLYFAIYDVAFLRDNLNMISGFITLAAGLVFLFIALLIECKTIVDYRWIETVPLGEIEKNHPRFPGFREIGITVVGGVALVILIVQFMLLIYRLMQTGSPPMTS